MVSAVAEILAPISEARQTEIGPLPSDWQVWPLGKLLVQAPSYGINAPAVPYDLRYPAYIRITDITDDGRFNPDGRASVAHPNAQAYHLEDGDIVLARTGASTGKSYRYRTEDGVLAFAGFLIRIRPDKGKLLTLYLSYQLQSAAYWNWVKTNSMRSGQPGINGKQYAAFLLSVPPTIIEQGAIATALSDADGLIEALESLIAKKRAVKQGAMQELLSGRTRLPGFSGEWQDKVIGEVASIDPENLGAQTPHDYAFNYIALEDVNVGSLVGYSERVFQTAPSRARRKLHFDDILVATVRPNLKSHLLFRSEHGEWICSTGFSVVRCCPGKATPGFIFAHLFGEIIARQIDALISGSNYPAINSRDVAALRVPIPPVNEQIAIAAALSDMDDELAALETRLAKARAIKQGMMQELLTGRVRLV